MKRIKRGPCHQVTSPLSTLLDTLSQPREAQSAVTIELWNADRLEPAQVDFFIANVKKVWPYDLFVYQEEAVLCYLAFKNYEV